MKMQIKQEQRSNWVQQPSKPLAIFSSLAGSLLGKTAVGMLLLLCLASSVWAQQKTAPILTIDGKDIPLEEFEYLFKKNYANADSNRTEQGIRDYMELYIKFKLKVAEASARKIDESKVFQSEFESYKRQLAKPYLTDNGITEGLIKEAYDRLHQEVRAAHILRLVRDWNNPADTLQAYQEIMRLKGLAEQNGTDFGQLAAENSEDPSARHNRGDLGYFTSMQMVYEFESAAYQTEVGKITGPIKTRYGYHLIKVTDKVQARGSCKVAHIMVRAAEGITPEDSVAAAKKAQEIYKKLKEGADWGELCRQFSDDYNNRENGGELPWFSTGQMVPSFSEAAFSLKNVGDISEPVLSPYGWHIIRLDGKKGVDEFKEVELKIRDRIRRDSRSELSRKLFIDKLRRENNFQEHAENKKAVFALFDSTLVQGKWQMPIMGGNKTLFAINGHGYPAQEFFLHVTQAQKPHEGHSVEGYAAELYDEFVSKTMMAYEEAHLAEKYSDYRFLLNEYREGMMLFDIMEKEVWAKAVEDSAGLLKFFEANRAKYHWGKRVYAQVFSLEKPELVAQVKADLKQPRFAVHRQDLESLVFAGNDTTLNRDHERLLEKALIAVRRHPEYSMELHSMAGAGEDASLADRRLALAMEHVLKFQVDSSRIVGMNKGTHTDAGRIDVRLFSTSPKALEGQYNAATPLAMEYSDGWFEKGTYKALDKIDWKPGEYTESVDGRTFFMIVHKTDEPRGKAFEETKGAVIADYQNHLEEKWIEELRKKHAVKLNKKLFDTFVKENAKK